MPSIGESRSCSACPMAGPGVLPRSGVGTGRDAEDRQPPIGERIRHATGGDYYGAHLEKVFQERREAALRSMDDAGRQQTDKPLLRRSTGWPSWPSPSALLRGRLQPVARTLAWPAGRHHVRLGDHTDEGATALPRRPSGPRSRNYDATLFWPGIAVGTRRRIPRQAGHAIEWSGRLRLTVGGADTGSAGLILNLRGCLLGSNQAQNLRIVTLQIIWRRNLHAIWRTPSMTNWLDQGEVPKGRP